MLGASFQCIHSPNIGQITIASSEVIAITKQFSLENHFEHLVDAQAMVTHHLHTTSPLGSPRAAATSSRAYTHMGYSPRVSVRWCTSQTSA